MNRTVINGAVLGSAGTTPYIVGVIRDTLALVGKVTTSLTKSAGMSVTMRLSAVTKGSRELYGKAIGTLELIGLNVGNRNHYAYQAVGQELILEPKAIAYINHLKYTPINQEMLLVGTETGTDEYTGAAGRVVYIPPSDRTIILPEVPPESKV